MAQQIKNRQKQILKDNKAQKHSVRILKAPKDIKKITQFPPECITHNKC
jgi:hypothetical protein